MNEKSQSLKDHYRQLRLLSCSELWERGVEAFDQANARERMNLVSVVRAVGVVFSESGTDTEKRRARAWLRALLHDPQEKVRRYAMTALPKLGAEAEEESAVLEMLERPASTRERRALGQTLEKIGGAAALAHAGKLGGRTAQKIQANVARATQPGALRLQEPIRDFRSFELVLHCRRGLENILAEEAGANSRFGRPRTRPGAVLLRPPSDYRLADIFELRCFSSMAFLLGTAADEESLPEIIASSRAQRLLESLTEGRPRYRLAFAGQGHRRGAVRAVTDRVYELCPALLNDSREALWQIDLVRHGTQWSVELTPRLHPEPRFAYRLHDVPAASHPPLAAAMAWLAQPLHDAVIWDPFCGSGLELIECARRGGVRRAVGTDLSETAVGIARGNFTNALGENPERIFVRGDFRDQSELRPGSVSLIVTNPPMGRRVPVPDLPELIADLFRVAEEVLAPGGQLIFANPLPVRPRGGVLRKELRQKVDLGGFHVHLEKYRLSRVN